MDRPRVGVNIASMLPWSAVPRFGLRIADWMARQAGYDFLQALPLRGVPGENIRTQLPIRYIERAWNATTLVRHLRGELGEQGMPATWLDVLFFPGPEECSRRYFRLNLGISSPNVSIGITHELEKALRPNILLLEVSPRHRKTWEYYQKLGNVGQRLVLDTKHIREEHEGFMIGSNQPEALLDHYIDLLPYCALIHVQAEDAREWIDFLAGRPTVMGTMLRIAKGFGYKGDYVVEMKPGATGFMGLLNPAPSLRRARETVLEIVG